MKKMPGIVKKLSTSEEFYKVNENIFKDRQIKK